MLTTLQFLEKPGWAARTGPNNVLDGVVREGRLSRLLLRLRRPSLEPMRAEASEHKQPAVGLQRIFGHASRCPRIINGDYGTR
ncbi:hypothetical protein VTJ04DRAFT_4151 [Mycothermus thermophilus]|uniref:uncharacterized protein n=1 Tax=Humicola insolens TaxID=85995 RepID=UPI003742D34B